MSVLRSLIGLTIAGIEDVHDYVQIVFSDGTTLSIFSRHHQSGGSEHGLEGKEVQSIEEVTDGVLIVLDEGSISIGLKDEDFNGPEAMVLMRVGEPAIVWR